MNKFKGKIFYINTDSCLLLKQIWASIESKAWGNKYKKEEIEITRDDIYVITQFYNLDYVKQLIDNKKNNVNIKRENIFYFPIYHTPFFNYEKKDFKTDYKYELLYWGGFRSGKREKKFLKYYFHKDVKTTFIGNLKLSDFNPKNTIGYNPEFKPAIDVRLLHDEINSALSTIYIGDKEYEANSFTLRICETVLNSIVCFVDIDMDPKKQLFNKYQSLKDFNYVSSKEEVAEKIKIIKNNIELRKNIVEKQFNCFNYKETDYLGMFNSIIEEKEPIIFFISENNYLCESFNQSDIKDWKNIEENRKSYKILWNNGIEYLRFPGFCFSQKEDALFYYENFYKKIENIFTPPRGNLLKNKKYVFIGIKPGSYHVNEKLNEAAWLFGPSSEMLDRMLKDVNIYPYFTNVYKFYKDEENKDISLITDELNIIKKIRKENIFVFMGNYDEYDLIIRKMELQEEEYRKIWHPSYLCREYNNEKFKKWKEQLKIKEEIKKERETNKVNGLKIKALF